MRPPLPVPSIAIGLCLALASGCDDRDPSYAGPTQPGSNPTQVFVNVTTAGLAADLDSDGYTVDLSGDARGVPINGQVRFTNLQPGSHTVHLTGTDPNCSVVSIVPPTGPPVTGQATIQVGVVAGTTVQVRFEVGCAPNVGQIVVFNDTRGDPAVSHYSAIVAGPDQNVSLGTPPNFNLHVDGIRVGPVTVQLNGVPAHCLLAGANPARVDLAFGQSITVAYVVDCTGTMGSLTVTTRTVGATPDPDGYLVNVADQTIGFSNNFSYDFGLLPVGDHVVSLFDVAPNCSVVPSTPHTVTILPAQARELIFDVTCGAVGGVRVPITTSGASLDPDGYTLAVDGQSRSVPINPAASIVVSNLAAGAGVQVALTDVAPNCSVAESNPQTVTVVQNTTTDAPGFTVTCVASGTLEVTTTTTGPTTPSGGFQLRIGSTIHAIGANETLRVPNLAAGNVEVTLLEDSPTCVVAAPNPRTVDVAADATAQTTFSVSCPAPTPPVIFESDRDGDFDIYAMNPDGSGLVALTFSGGDDIDASWSWDDQRIVFVSDRGGQSDVWVMEQDGSNPVRITNDAAVNEDPEFSPDGSKIAYEREDPDDGSLEIFIADADGSNPVQLTDANGISEAPHFHPDGTEILFKSDRDGDFEIYLMNVDGSNVRQLTNTSVDDFDASWSPDGTTIVFSSQRAAPTREDLWTMNRDGSGQTRILFNADWDWHPVFSTDGARIVFTSDRDADGDYELFIMNADGTGVTQLTSNSATDDDAEFRKPGN